MAATMAAKYDEIAAKESDKDAQVSAARVRGPDGKFASTKPKTESAAAPIEATGTEPTETQAVEPPVEAPAHWTSEDKAEFEKLKDADARKLAIGMSKRLEAAHTRKSQETAGHLKAAEPFLGVAKHFEAQLSQRGIGAAQHAQYFGGLAEAENALHAAAQRNDPQPFYDLMARYGFTPGAPSQAAGQQPDQRELRELRAEVQSLKQREAQRTEDARAQVSQSASTDVQAFQDSKDAQGKPAHPHFDEVRVRMAALMGADPALTLDKAYDQACWADPTVRQKLLDASKAAETAKQTEQARQAAASAQRANGVNVRSGGGSSKPAPGATIGETMRRVYDSIPQ
jgi:hypothetical protein